MVEPISLITVIGLGLTALIYLFKWTTQGQEAKQKKVDDIDKEIDNANDAGSLFKLFNKLRNK